MTEFRRMELFAAAHGLYWPIALALVALIAFMIWL